MPETEELFQKQKEWAEDGLQTLREFLPLMSTVGTFQWNAEERKTIGYLASATARTSESALLLCAYGQLWDAEILVRSVLEGTLKFSYLLQSRDSFAERHREYADDLFVIGRFKDHAKAEKFLETAKQRNDPMWRPTRDLLIPAHERAELSAKYSRIVRKDLTTRWGFTGLIKELADSGDPLFRDLGATAHAYSIASHIQHVDMIGASMALERDLRSEPRREAIQLAHLGRLVGDVLRFMFLRLALGYRFTGADVAPLEGVKATIDAETTRFDRTYRAWMEVEYPSNSA